MALTVTEIVAGAKMLQEICIEEAHTTSRLVAAMQRHDKRMLKETIKTLYHLNWSLKDLSDALKEITQQNGWSGIKDDHSITLAEAEDYEFTTGLRSLLSKSEQIHIATIRLIHNLLQVGVELKLVPKFNARVSLDVMFLQKDLEELGLV